MDEFEIIGWILNLLFQSFASQLWFVWKLYEHETE
jgi:hypothetical protein